MTKISNLQERLIVDRYSRGVSGPEIAKSLRVTLRQVYYVLKRRRIYVRAADEAKSLVFKKKPESFEFLIFEASQNKELLIAASVLYFSHGTKTGNSVDLAHSDIRAVKIFLKFLRIVLKVQENKLRFYLNCRSDQNPDELIQFWSKELKVDKNLFTKPYIRPAVSSGKRIMPWGVLHVRYNDKRLLEKILALCSSIVAQLT